jgi:AcrR family transcriptional regulator
MRLFAQQGYDETTVEQIAAAAEISPSTFFRYFKTKEDVVVQDRYDDMIIEAIIAAPKDLAPVQAIRHALGQAFVGIDAAEIEQSFERARLVLNHPALRARSLQNMVETTGAMSVALAARMGREPSDTRVRALCGACMGALLECVMRWLEHGGPLIELAAMIDEALDVVENGI